MNILLRTCIYTFLALETVTFYFPGTIRRKSDIRRTFSGTCTALWNAGFPVSLAMERSPVKDVEIKALLKAALTEKIHDRTVYMKGIDASYHYEGYHVFRTEDL